MQWATFSQCMILSKKVGGSGKGYLCMQMQIDIDVYDRETTGKFYDSMFKYKFNIIDHVDKIIMNYIQQNPYYSQFTPNATYHDKKNNLNEISEIYFNTEITKLQKCETADKN